MNSSQRLPCLKMSKIGVVLIFLVVYTKAGLYLRKDAKSMGNIKPFPTTTEVFTETTTEQTTAYVTETTEPHFEVDDGKQDIATRFSGKKPMTAQNATISIAYKPTRPPYHPNPGPVLGQIIPPGKPWPSSEEGYQNFSALHPNAVNRIHSDKP